MPLKQVRMSRAAAGPGLLKGKFPIGSYLKVKFGSDSTKRVEPFFHLSEDYFSYIHLKAFLYGFILSSLHGLKWPLIQKKALKVTGSQFLNMKGAPKNLEPLLKISPFK